MEDGHAKTVDEVLNYFNADPEKGLSPDQVRKNQEKYGPNGKCELPPTQVRRTNVRKKFLVTAQRQPCRIKIAIQLPQFRNNYRAALKTVANFQKQSHL